MGKIKIIDGDGLINTDKDGNVVETINLKLNERHCFITDDGYLYVIDNEFLDFLKRKPIYDLQAYPDKEFFKRVTLFRV